jgi:hypothetical protein
MFVRMMLRMQVKYWVIAATLAFFVSLISSGCGSGQDEAAPVGKESQAAARETRKKKPTKKRQTVSRSESRPKKRAHSANTGRLGSREPAACEPLEFVQP